MHMAGPTVRNKYICNQAIVTYKLLTIPCLFYHEYVFKHTVLVLAEKRECSYVFKKYSIPSPFLGTVTNPLIYEPYKP